MIVVELVNWSESFGTYVVITVIPSASARLGRPSSASVRFSGPLSARPDFLPALTMGREYPAAVPWNRSAA